MSPKDMLRRVPATWQAIGVVVAIAGVGWTGGWASVRAEVAEIKADQQQAEDVMVDVRIEIAEMRRKLDRADCILTALATERDPVEACGL